LPRYDVVLLAEAERALEKLATGDRRSALRIAATLRGLASDPRPAGARALVGSGGQLRVRVGDYRVVYAIEDARLIVTVIRIGHRREICRR
jgi:mRNA interferase RelE/StbE